MDKRVRQKYSGLSPRKLRLFVGDLQELIAELERGLEREIDIASKHSGDPALVTRVHRTDGNPQSGKWHQVELTLCSTERCPSCPHGDFRYHYRRSKNGRGSKKYTGTKVMDHETIEWLRAGVHKPIVVCRVETTRD